MESYLVERALVPTLRVGMPSSTLCVGTTRLEEPRSGGDGILTETVGTSRMRLISRYIHMS